MYLQHGQWEGKQLVSGEWVAEATRKQVDSQDNDGDWGQGYGYQFWRCKPGGYRGDGAYGQYCIVLPEQEAVIAITSESRDMGAGMQLVWDHILPAMQDEATLTEDESAHEALTQRLAQLRLPTVKKSAADTVKQEVDNRTYRFEANDFKAETVSFHFNDDQCEVEFVEDGQPIQVVSGLSRWMTADARKEGDMLFAIQGRTPMPTKIASYYYWDDPQTLVMTLKYVENAHHDVFTFSFAGQGLTLAFDNSVAFQRDQTDDRSVIKAAVTR